MCAEDQKTILLVEDEVLIAMAEAMIVENFGYKVITAITGKEAVEAVEKTPGIDLILMDIDLGRGLSGPEAAAQILNERALPIVFLTSHSEREMVERVRGITHYGYVIKNSGDFVLQSSIEMAFELFDAHVRLTNELSARKLSEETLRASEARFRSYFELPLTGRAISSPGKVWLDVNGAMCAMFGYTKTELLQMTWAELTHPDDLAENVKQFDRVMSGEIDGYTLEKRFIHKDGHFIHTHLAVQCLRCPDRSVDYFVTLIQDISESRQAEDALLQEKLFTDGMINALVDTVFLFEPSTGRPVRWNRRFTEVSGYSDEEIAGMKAPDNFYDDEDIRKAEANVNRIVSEGQSVVELALITKSGTRIPFEYAAKAIGTTDGKTLIISIGRDVTERRRAENLLIDAAKKWQTTFDGIKDSIFILDLDGKILQANKSSRMFWDKNEKELTGCYCFDIAHGSECHIEGCPLVKMKRSKQRETMLRSINDKWFETIVDPILDEMNDVIGAVHVVTDITERKRMENELRRRNRMLRMLSETNQHLIRATREAELLDTVCRFIVEEGGYSMAWAGFAEQDAAKSVRPVAHAGFGEGYLDTVNITWADAERGRGPTGIAIRTGKTTLARNIPGDPDYGPWREAAIQRGYLSSVALPLTADGGTLGALNIYAAEADAFDGEEIALLTELAGDVMYGIASLRTREALRGSEERFRKVFDDGPIGMVLTSRSMQFFSANPAFCRMLGYTADEMNGKTFLDVTHPDYRDTDRENVEKLWRGKLPLYRTEKRYIAKNGDIRWGNLSASLILEPDGKPLYALAMIEDITERKQAEETLYSSQQITEGIINSMPASVFWKDRNLIYLGCNSAFARDAGYTDPKDVIGKDDYQMVWRNQAELYRGDDRQVIENGCSRLLIEEPQTTPKGNTITLLTSKIPLRNTKGEINGVLGTYMDITERKRVQEALRVSEAHLRTVLDATPFPIALVDAQDENIHFWSLSALTLFGHTAPTADEWYRIAYPDPDYRGDVIERWKPFLEKARLSAEAINAGEYRITCRDGSVRICELYAAFLADDLIVTFNDVTERKQSEEKIISLLAEKELILKEVHHRVKNHMNTMNGLLTIQASKTKEPAAIAALKDAAGRVQSMTVLYDKLYRSSDFHEMSVQEYLPSLLDQIAGNFPNSGSIKIEKRIDDFILDAKRLSTLGIILNELLTNIMKYAFPEREDGLVVVSAALKDHTVSLVVQDDGIGIPEQLNFENSTGFGLVLVGMLTKQLGGSLRMEREGGTKIVLEFEK